MSITPDAIDAALKIVQDAFKRVGPFILEHAGKIGYADKKDGSPLTDTDIEVEEKLKAEIGSAGIPAYGEEAGYDDNMTGAFWLIDPIDGTKDFIENVPRFTTVAVLIQGGEAVAAAIYNPSTQNMYTAQKGRGAYKNGVRLDLGAVQLPGIAWCKRQFIDELNGMLAPKSVVCEEAPRGGSYGFALVAEGQAAARFNLHGGGYTHDYAPGALIVREAGGAIIPVLDDVYTYKTRSFVACHPDLASTIRPYVPRLRELEALKAAKQ
ncbi:MAG TPA: inositol monophosphatase family protein [Patescibacteria group bacterium]|nr:inositol monophosphatase family protein [Patescibacteria group bacterium]